MTNYYKVTYKDSGEYINTVGYKGWTELDARTAVAKALSAMDRPERPEDGELVDPDDLIAIPASEDDYLYNMIKDYK
jgi:hypothetical protein